jgi:hypothetical protein
MKAEEAYKAELKRSDIDHHKPTAGAMVGHIIANLLELLRNICYNLKL